MQIVIVVVYALFLSTLSLRRATSVRPETRQRDAISIHALLAESDGCEQYYIHAPGISIHALLAESDLTAYLGDMELSISIHALLAESDKNKKHCMQREIVFLSTLSLRRATAADISTRRGASISIHALLAESDARRDSRQQPAGISIHALLAESDADPEP